MDATQQHDVSTGITYAVRHLRTIFLTSTLIWAATWKTDGAGDEHERSRANIETKLSANDSYVILGAGTVIQADALGYIYRTDGVMDKLARPAKDGSGGWGETRSLITKFLDDMDSDLRRIVSARNQLVPATVQTSWIWDASREQYYIYDSADRIYKYHGGLWVRLDGSHTSCEQERQLAKARKVPAQTLLGHQNSMLSVTASMRQITMGRGEDAALK